MARPRPWVPLTTESVNGGLLRMEHRNHGGDQGWSHGRCITQERPRSGLMDTCAGFDAPQTVTWMLMQVPSGRVIGWVEDPDGVVREVICSAPALNAILRRPWGRRL